MNALFLSIFTLCCIILCWSLRLSGLCWACRSFCCWWFGWRFCFSWFLWSHLLCSEFNNCFCQANIYIYITLFLLWVLIEFLLDHSDLTNYLGDQLFSLFYLVLKLFVQVEVLTLVYSALYHQIHSFHKNIQGLPVLIEAINTKNNTEILKSENCAICFLSSLFKDSVNSMLIKSNY